MKQPSQPLGAGWFERLWGSFKTFWNEVTAGRSYSSDYLGLSLAELLETAQVTRLPLDGTARYFITSDHHRRYSTSGTDHPATLRIAAHRSLYEQALQFYAQTGYTLIEAGDMEELWRVKGGAFTWVRTWEKIQQAYAPIYRQIRNSFVENGRYVRLWGNHDAIWRLDKYRLRYLAPVVGDGAIYEMALIGDRYLVMHGHAVDRWNNDRRGWFLGRMFSLTPINLDAVRNVVADPDGTYPNWVGGRHRRDWLARSQTAAWLRHLLHDTWFHPVRAVECDPVYVTWAKHLGLCLICGHTHEPAMFPHHDAKEASPYINCGSGLGETELQGVEILEDGTPQAVKWTREGRHPLCFKPGAATGCSSYPPALPGSGRAPLQ